MQESWKVLIFLVYHGKLSRMNIRALKIDPSDSVNRWLLKTTNRQDLNLMQTLWNDERGTRLVTYKCTDIICESIELSDIDGFEQVFKILICVFFCDKNREVISLGLSGGKSKPRVLILYWFVPFFNTPHHPCPREPYSHHTVNRTRTHSVSRL